MPIGKESIKRAAGSAAARKKKETELPRDIKESKDTEGKVESASGVEAQDSKAAAEKASGGEAKKTAPKKRTAPRKTAGKAKTKPAEDVSTEAKKADALSADAAKEAAEPAAAPEQNPGVSSSVIAAPAVMPEPDRSHYGIRDELPVWLL